MDEEKVIAKVAVALETCNKYTKTSDSRIGYSVACEVKCLLNLVIFSPVVGHLAPKTMDP